MTETRPAHGAGEGFLASASGARNATCFMVGTGITLADSDAVRQTFSRVPTVLLTPSGVQGHTVSFQCRDEAAVARTSRIATKVGRYCAKESIRRVSLHSAEVGALSPAEAEEAICLEVDKAMTYGESVPLHADKRKALQQQVLGAE